MSREGKIPPTRSPYCTVVLAVGVVAAYLMYRRGTPILTIARRTLTNPVGALVGELRGAQLP